MNLAKGAILFVQRTEGIYRKHFGVSLGNGFVMHFNNTDYSYDLIHPIIHKVCLAEFLGLNKEQTKDIVLGKVNPEFFILNPLPNSKYYGDAIVRRALECEGCNYYNSERNKYEKRDVGYGAFYDNCEHFAIWCLTGEHRSEQTKDHIPIAIFNSITKSSDEYNKSIGTKVLYSKITDAGKNSLMLNSSLYSGQTKYARNIANEREYGNTRASANKFRCDNWGENSYAVCEKGLRVGERVNIDGNEDLSKYIKFNNGGCVYSICLVAGQAVFSRFTIRVVAEEPHGSGSGSGYLRFYDKDGDSYYLSINDSNKTYHTLDYNSNCPDIVRIEWSNSYIADKSNETVPPKNVFGSPSGFFCDRIGEDSYATCPFGFEVGKKIKIGGNGELSKIIRFNDEGCVYSIKVIRSSSSKYTIEVDAEGPHGALSGAGYLRFYDKSGDSYYLKILDSTRKIHTVDYRSDAPELVKIKWSNKYISS